MINTIVSSSNLGPGSWVLTQTAWQTHHPGPWAPSLLTWGPPLACTAVAGTRICGPAVICGSVGAGPAD